MFKQRVKADPQPARRKLKERTPSCRCGDIQNVSKKKKFTGVNVSLDCGFI